MGAGDRAGAEGVRVARVLATTGFASSWETSRCQSWSHSSCGGLGAEWRTAGAAGGRTEGTTEDRVEGKVEGTADDRTGAGNRCGKGGTGSRAWLKRHSSIGAKFPGF